jgi:hypothetical protein
MAKHKHDAYKSGIPLIFRANFVPYYIKSFTYFVGVYHTELSTGILFLQHQQFRYAMTLLQLWLIRSATIDNC